MRLVVFLIAYALFHATAYAQEIVGKVINVTDGDTITIKTPSGIHDIRLAQIDAPEIDQIHGTRARKALGELLINRDVRINAMDVDRYGRIVGQVYLGKMDVNAHLVEQGHAWVYVKYAHDRQLFVLENRAREQRRGLWASDLRTPPWQFRKEKRRENGD